MLHKLSKAKSLSLAQNYLILSMPLGRSFVFRSFLQNVGLLRVYFCCSGPALNHSHHTHPRYSVPVQMPPRYSAPIPMPPSVCRDHHHPTHLSSHINVDSVKNATNCWAIKNFKKTPTNHDMDIIYIYIYIYRLYTMAETGSPLSRDLFLTEKCVVCLDEETSPLSQQQEQQQQQCSCFYDLENCRCNGGSNKESSVLFFVFGFLNDWREWTQFV